MSLKLVSAPVGLAVLLADAKAHLRVDFADDDALITSYIKAATAAAEHETGRALITQEWEAVYDAFPDYAIELGKPPIQAIVNVTYTADNGSPATIPPGDYVLDKDRPMGFVLPAAGKAWPATADTANAVRVRFRCGYGDAASAVPENVKAWILLHVGSMYKQRESVVIGTNSADLPNRFHAALLDSERVY